MAVPLDEIPHRAESELSNSVAKLYCAPFVVFYLILRLMERFVQNSSVGRDCLRSDNHENESGLVWHQYHDYRSKRRGYQVVRQSVRESVSKYLPGISAISTWSYDR